jgi:hypothetical protein
LAVLDLPAVDETLRRWPTGLFVTPNLATAFATFAFLLHRHAVEVAPQAAQLEQVVEIIEKFAVFESVVTEELADMGVVFLLHVSLLVLEVGPRTGLLDAMFPEPIVKVVIEELPPLSLSTPSRSNGWLSQIDSSPSKVACCLRFHTARSSVQPLEISTLVSVQMKSAPMSPPQCATVSGVGIEVLEFPWCDKTSRWAGAGPMGNIDIKSVFERRVGLRA